MDRNGKHIQMTLSSILPKLSSQAVLIICSDHKAGNWIKSFHRNIWQYCCIFIAGEKI